MRLLKLTLLSLVLLPATALADSPLKQGADTAQPTTVQDGKTVGTGPTHLFGTDGVFSTIANVLIFLTGALSVIAIIFGGFRYVTSTGDAGRVKQAKDTILYGVIGLVVALLAYAIVNFVLKNLN